MKNTDQTKNLLLEQLRKSPIIETACMRAGISRMTLHRWKRDDAGFAKQVDEALMEGRLFVSDLAEHQLISAIKDRNLPAVTYWLRHHHPTYANRLEVTAKIKEELEPLTPEQEEVVKQALRMASLSSIYSNNSHLYDDPNSNDNSTTTGPNSADAEGSKSENGDSV